MLENYVLVSGIWTMVFLVIVHGIWSEVLTPGIGSKVSVLRGLEHGIERGLNLYKEKNIIRPKGKCENNEYLMKCEI